MMISTWKHVRDAVGAVAISAVAAAGSSLIVASSLLAQTYPSKPIKFILPLAADSPINAMARVASSGLSSRVGQPVIVENRPGGGGTIGTKSVAIAAPDGHTLLFVGVNHVFAPSMSKSIDYDPIKDFSPIATFATGAWIVVVAPSLPATSVRELIAYAKANPGQLNWGFGQATGPHLFGEMFMAATGIDAARIPYKSGPQAIPDMLGGRIQINIGGIPALLPLIQEGKLRALAISSQTRSPDLPNVPTMSESGFPHLTHVFWSGLLAPARTPAVIVNRLNAEINATLVTSEMRASLVTLGFDPKGGSPQDFAALLTDEIEFWGAAAKAAGIVPE